jgi:hypothetical protein
MNKYINVALIVGLAVGVGACDPQPPKADQVQKQQQEQISMQATMAVGMPAITKFAERRLLKDIYELRDQLIPTFTYLSGEMNGTIGEKVCDSLGYGIPYATQFTSPQKDDWHSGNNGGHYVVLPQADPNALFSPSNADGTWVMCKEPGTDKIMPQYIEPKVITLTFPKESRK